jgi:hypothetical protein
MFGRDPWPPSRLASEAERRERLGLLAGDMSFMPNGTLDGFNHVLDFDEGLTHVFRITAIVFLRQKLRDVAAVRNLSISCCDQLLNVFVILSHSGGLLLINLFAQQPPRFEPIDRGGFNWAFVRHHWQDESKGIGRTAPAKMFEENVGH